MAKVKINTAKIDRAFDAAVKDLGFIVQREIIQTISDTSAFPEFPGQDIIDQGFLKGAQQTPEFNGDTITFRNSIEYAIFVHEGFTYRNGREQPGRPWMVEAINRVDLEKTFAKLLGQNL